MLTICHKDILICLILKVYCFICHIYFYNPTKIDIYEYYDLGIQFPPPPKDPIDIVLIIERTIIFAGHNGIDYVTNKLTVHVGV